MNENKGKRITNGGRNDTAAVSRFGSCFLKDDYIIEKEQYSPSLMLAYRMAQVFGITVEELCCLKENKELEDKQYENL